MGLQAQAANVTNGSTTIPNFRNLEVNGDVTLTGNTANGYALLQVTSSGGSSLWTDGGSVTYLTDTTDNVGIGITTASTELYVNGDVTAVGEFIELTGSSVTGGFTLITTSKSSSFTADSNATVYLVDASSAAVTVTLPASSGVTNRVYYVKKTDSSSNLVTVDGNSAETIDGSTTTDLTAQYESIVIVCDGSNWFIL